MLKVGHVTSDLLCFLGSHTLLLMQDPNPGQCPSSVPRCTQEVSQEAQKQVWSAAAGFRSALLPVGQLCMSTSAGRGHGHRVLCLLPTSTTFRHKAAQSRSMNTCPSTEASVMAQNFRGAKAWQSVARLEGIAIFTLCFPKLPCLQLLPLRAVRRRALSFCLEGPLSLGDRDSVRLESA